MVIEPSFAASHYPGKAYRKPKQKQRFNTLLDTSRSSTGQPFCLFVEHGTLQPDAEPGSFNTYGLSQGASVPWF